MKNMPIDVLRTFVTVTQIGGFTHAGELLGRSQPAVSLQIKRLEEILGQPVFIRSGQQLELTQAGETLFHYARQILSLNDEALGQLDNKTLAGKVRLGIPSEFATTLLPKIVGRFTQAYPKVTLEVNCDLSKNLLSTNGRKRHDLILALYDDPKAGGHHQVKTDELVWVTSAEHDAHLHPVVPLIVAFEGCIYRNRAIAKLDEKNRPWRIVYTIPDLTGIQAAIEEGLGVTVLAKSTVPATLKILKRSDRFPHLGRVSINLVHTGKDANEAVKKISEYLKASLV